MIFMEDVVKLVDCIAPSIRFAGRRPFTLAIEQTCKLASKIHLEDILFTKQVYPAVAALCCCSYSSAERAIYRAVDACWMDGNNKALNLIIGCTMPVKPKPSELIMYCACFNLRGVPYHSSEAKASLLLSLEAKRSSS